MHRSRILPFLGAFLLLLPMGHPPAFAQEAADIDRWMEELSNWGRWGADDELGTLNLITPDKRRRAAGLVEDGVSISLAREVGKEKTLNNPSPLEHTLATGGPWAGDTYTINYHGYAHSHIDALSHMAYRDTLYNGFPSEGRKPTGVEKLGIQNMKNGILSRGVLVDLPRLKGVPYLEPGTAITAEDLEAWEKESGVQVEPGDVLLVRTGRWAREEAVGPWRYSGSAAGLHASVAKWLKARDVAVLGSDGASDVLPSGVEGVSHPVHQLAIIAMGMPILDNLDLEAIAREAAARDRWSFLFVASPLPVPGGTGAPLNPIATF